MSKRFGRNQRRQLREEIARLTKVKDAAITAMAIMDYGPWRPAGNAPKLEDLCLVVADTEVTDETTHRGLRRKARITLIIDDRAFHKLHDLTYASLPVAWRGIQWRMCAIDHDHYRGLRPENTIEVDLDAIGSNVPLWPSPSDFDLEAIRREREGFSPDEWRRLYQCQPLPSYHGRAIRPPRSSRYAF